MLNFSKFEIDDSNITENNYLTYAVSAKMQVKGNIFLKNH